MKLHIDSLAVENVRGITGVFTLGPATMIIGDNFRGKSALLCALRLAVFGFLPHPRKDKTVPPIDLASADHMSVAIRLSDGTEIARDWTRSKSGKVSSSTSPDELPTLAPAVLIDPKEYFDLSADKRMRYVFSNVRLPGDTFTPAALMAAVKNVTLEDGANTEHTQAALMEISASLQQLCDEFTAEGTATVQDLVAAVLEKLNENLKLVKQSVDRMAKTIGGLTELQMKKPEDFDNDLAGISADLAAARHTLEELTKENGALCERKRTLEQAASHAANLTKRTDEAKAWEEAVKSWTNRIATLEASISQPLDLKDVTALKSQLKSLSDESLTLGNTLVTLRSTVSSLQKELASVQADEAKHEALYKSVSNPKLDPDLCIDCSEKIRSRAAAAAEPHLKSWRSAEDVASKLTKTLSDASAELEAAEKRYAEVIKQHDSARSEINTAVLHNNSMNNTRQTETTALDNARGSLEHATQKVADIAAAKAELAALPPSDDAAFNAQWVANKAAIDKQAVIIRDLETKQRQAIGARTDAVRQMEALAERIKSEASRDMHKAVIETITEFQRQMVDASFGTLMGTAQRFCAGVLHGNIEYHQDLGEVGRRRNGRWVSIDQFSDAEQIIAYAAMTTALAASAAFKIVMIDELTRVRGVRKLLLAERMIELIEADVIDQFVGVDVETDDKKVPAYYEHPNITIIHLPG